MVNVLIYLVLGWLLTLFSSNGLIPASHSALVVEYDEEASGTTASSTFAINQLGLMKAAHTCRDEAERCYLLDPFFPEGDPTFNPSWSRTSSDLLLSSAVLRVVTTNIGSVLKMFALASGFGCVVQAARGKSELVLRWATLWGLSNIGLMVCMLIYIVMLTHGMRVYEDQWTEFLEGKMDSVSAKFDGVFTRKGTNLYAAPLLAPGYSRWCWPAGLFCSLVIVGIAVRQSLIEGRLSQAESPPASLVADDEVAQELLAT